MDAKKKAKILEITGLAASILFPAFAAVVEFPHVKSQVSGGTSFLDVLNISAAAFAIIAVIAVLAFWRFFREKFKISKSGLFPTIILTVIVYGVYQFIYAFLIIMVWASVGAFIAQILYIIADKIRENNDGSV